MRLENAKFCSPTYELEFKVIDKSYNINICFPIIASNVKIEEAHLSDITPRLEEQPMSHVGVAVQ